MLKIDDLDKLKITSITAVVHFKYKDEYYFVHENTEATTTTAIYKGRSKYKNECLKSTYGFINNLIKYKNNKRVLSAIDKVNFVKKLYKAGLIDTYDEIKEQVEKEKQEYKDIMEQIYKLQGRLTEIINN